MSSKKEWPKTVRVGHASVKVYRNAEPDTASGWIYVVAWRTPTGRKREKFADEATALAEARTKATQLREAVEVAGVPVRADTIGGVIMRRLVIEARAEVVPVPAEAPAKRQSLSVGSVYDGEDAPLRSLAAQVETKAIPEPPKTW